MIQKLNEGIYDSHKTQDLFAKLYEDLHMTYIKKFTSQLRKLDLASKKCHVDFDMDFKGVVLDVLKKFPEMQPDLKVLLKKEASMIHDRFVNEKRGELAYMYSIYCEYRMIKAEDLIIKATYLLIQANRNPSLDQKAIAVRFFELVKAYLDIRWQEYQDDSHKKKVELLDYFRNNALKTFQILAIREENYNLNKQKSS